MPSPQKDDADKAAFIERNIQSIIPMLKKLASRYGLALTETDYEDFRQDVIVILLDGGLDNFRGDCADSTWIFYACRRVVIDSMKSRKDETMRHSAEFNSDIDYEKKNSTVSLFRQVDDEVIDEIILDEIFSLINHEVKKLPEEKQLVFRMLADGVRKKEIARMVNKSPATVTYYKNELFQLLSQKIDAQFPRKLIIN